jgi:hypothetical protein
MYLNTFDSTNNKKLSTAKIKVMKLTINLLLQRLNSSPRKKLFVACISVIFIAVSAFANGEETNAKAISHLKKEFKNAKDIEWKVTPQYTKAAFTWNGQHLEVFYNSDGETIAESKYINTNNLPLKAQQFINKKYADYTITEAVEFYSEESGLCYYVSLTKDNLKQILKITTDGTASLFRPE